MFARERFSKLALVVLCFSLINLSLHDQTTGSAPNIDTTQESKERTTKGNFIVAFKSDVGTTEAQELAQRIVNALKTVGEENFGAKEGFNAPLFKFLVLERVSKVSLETVTSASDIAPKIRYIEDGRQSARRPSVGEPFSKFLPSSPSSRGRSSFSSNDTPSPLQERTLQTTAYTWTNPPYQYIDGMSYNWWLSILDDHPDDQEFDTYSNYNGTNVHIFIVDTGVDANHPEFRQGYYYDTSASSRVIIEPSCTFYDNTLVSESVVNTDPGTTHATSVASIAAGLNVGIAKNATIHSCKIFPTGLETTSSTYPPLALNYIIGWKQANPTAKVVVNLSFGFATPTQSPTTLSTLDNSINSATTAGILVVCSAGNPDPSAIPQELNNACYWDPCRSSNSICVGGIQKSAANDTYFERWNETIAPLWSAYGPCVDIWTASTYIWAAVTPEVRIRDIFSRVTSYSYTYGLSKGTSFAAPAVAGVLASIWSGNPSSSAASVKNYMYAIAKSGLIGNLNDLSDLGTTGAPNYTTNGGADRFLHILNSDNLPGPTQAAQACPTVPNIDEGIVAQLNCPACEDCCAIYLDDPANGLKNKLIRVDTADTGNLGSYDLTFFTFGNGTGTFQFWFYPMTADYGTLLWRAGAHGLRLYKGKVQVYLALSNSSAWCEGATWCDTGASPNLEKWNHLTFSVDLVNTSLVAVYLNMKLVWSVYIDTSASVHVLTGSSSTDYAATFGNIDPSSGSDPFYGRLVDFRFWMLAFGDPGERLPGLSVGWGDPSMMSTFPDDIILTNSNPNLDSFINTFLNFNYRMLDCQGSQLSDWFYQSFGNAYIPSEYFIPNPVGWNYGLLPGVEWIYHHIEDNEDGDDWVYDLDNCPNTPNNDQKDTNRNGIGDVCDPCPSCCAAQLWKLLPAANETDTGYYIINNISSSFNPYFFTVQFYLYPFARETTGLLNYRADLVKKEGLFEIGLDYKGELRLGFVVQGIKLWFLTGAIPLPLQWTAVTVTRNSGLFEVYVNGGKVNGVLPYQLKGLDTSGDVFNGWELGKGFAGEIDNFLIWDRPLSPQDVVTYDIPLKNPAVEKADGVLHDFTFDECQDEVDPIDRVGNAETEVVGYVFEPAAEDQQETASIHLKFEAYIDTYGNLVELVPEEPAVQQPLGSIVGVDFNFRNLIRVQSPSLPVLCRVDEKGKRHC